MLERAAPDAADTLAPAASLTGRRLLFSVLVGLSIAGLIGLLTFALTPGGIGAVDVLLIAMFAVTLPWIVIGFWNATIGLLIMRFAADPVAAVMPAAARVRDDDPITASTAVLLCIRNEPTERVVRYLAPTIEGLAARGAAAERIHIYVLSDSNDAAIVADEEARFSALAGEWRDRIRINYRRRAINTGFKAGNIRDFCARHGKEHDFALVLDADSVMTGDAVLRLIRIMQADPRLGILQSLVTGLPSASAFARIFQFGMRLGMRSYTIGSAWWQGDCGPYWGHNAILRLAPFMAHCELPTLPQRALVGGHVLSHDQVEAVLMRRAGYEVRVLPEEGASFEQNPPTLIEFVRRDFRWCQGNMQYWHFLTLPGLRPVSRYQLAFAILMFLGSPGWIGLLVVGTAVLALSGSAESVIRADAGLAVFILVLIGWFAPKIATVIDVLTRRDLRRAFGGGIRFVAGVITETIFFVLLAPIMWFGHTLFLVRLLLGRKIGWGAQLRDDHEVPLRMAVRQFWPQTLLGLATLGALALTVPAAIPYALFVAGGPLVSIPLALVTSSPAVGRALLKIGLGRLPEETSPPPELLTLDLPALAQDTMAGSRVRLRDAWRIVSGVVRSLRLYYGDAAHRTAMHRLYGEFIKPGDLAFDIGAHVGDRVGAFRRLGARVVAVEPQPALAAMLRLLYGRDGAVTIERAAVGRRAGTLNLKLNIDNPTVSTASDEFVRATHGAPGWDGQSWPRTIPVAVVTLDQLIARHGPPAFIKIDVEGFEAEALAGLTQPPPVLSFEFTTVQRAVAARCIARCAALGYTRFNAAQGESHVFEHPQWQTADEIARWLAALPDDYNSGDVYAAM